MLISPKRPKTRTPFRGKPTTWALHHKDKTLRGYRIKAEYITPLRARIADALAIGSTGGAMLAGFHVASIMNPQDAGLAMAAGAACMLAYPVLKFLHRRHLRTSRIVEVTADTFRINGLLGWKAYDRNLPHRFSILQHDKAQIEWEEQDLAARKAAQKGKVISQEKYYQLSWHVVFEYNLQRIDIADVYGIKDARAIQARLSGCAQVIDAQAGAGPGPALHPSHEWFDGAGRIPD